MLLILHASTFKIYDLRYQSTCFHSIKRLEQALIGSDGRDLFASALLAVLRAVQSLKIEADDLQSSNGA